MVHAHHGDWGVENSPSLEHSMALILSCLTKGDLQTRTILEQLSAAGIVKNAIIVLHAGDDLRSAEEGQSVQPRLPPVSPEHQQSSASQTAVGAAASGSAAGGMFGWLLGFGVLALPGAILGGAIGAVAGAAIGATRQTLHPDVPESVALHYGNRIIDDYAAILVKVEDATHHDLVMRIMVDGKTQHILTSTNDRALAAASQLDAIPQLAIRP